MRHLTVATAVLVVCLSLCGCGATTRPATTSLPSVSTPTPASPDPVKVAAQPAPAVRVANTAYGLALADRRGFALYRFTHDRSASSTCYGACAVAWPPYLVAQRPKAAAGGANASLLGAVRRRDGRLQLTYAGRPLYHYVGDRRPGQVLCQGVVQFGGAWNVVSPSGRAIG